VHESVAEKFIAEAKSALIALYSKDPKNNPDYSRVINAREVSRLAALLEPAKVIAGGKSDPDASYLDPTLVYPVTWDDKIMEDEVFWPNSPHLDLPNTRRSNGANFQRATSLAAFIFSRDQKAIDRFTGGLSFGGGAVNQVNVHLFVESMPFGGVGSAGIGHYYGKYGFDMLTHAKSMLISKPGVAIEHLFPPYTRKRMLS